MEIKTFLAAIGRNGDGSVKDEPGYPGPTFEIDYETQAPESYSVRIDVSHHYETISPDEELQILKSFYNDLIITFPQAFISASNSKSFLYGKIYVQRKSPHQTSYYLDLFCRHQQDNTQLNESSFDELSSIDTPLIASPQVVTRSLEKSQW